MSLRPATRTNRLTGRCARSTERRGLILASNQIVKYLRSQPRNPDFSGTPGAAGLESRLGLCRRIYGIRNEHPKTLG
jgi:hypothetical protein